jgi:hypothetical protein
MVERIATNKDIDADKLQKVLDVQMQIMDRQARDEFYADMNRVQAELPAVLKVSDNPQTKSRYANLESISKAITPVYTKYGFSASFTQAQSELPEHLRIAGALSHKAGYCRDDYFVDVPLDKTGIGGKINKTDIWATGSSFSYGRRYLKAMMFDVATADDDDGAIPTAALTEEQIRKVSDMLVQLPPDDQASFWKKAKLSEGEFESLLAHRYATYTTWLEQHGAVA